MTVTGKTLGENLEEWTHKYGELDSRQDVIRPLDNPIKSSGHIRCVRFFMFLREFILVLVKFSGFRDVVMAMSILSPRCSPRSIFLSALFHPYPCNVTPAPLQILFAVPCTFPFMVHDTSDRVSFWIFMRRLRSSCRYKDVLTTFMQNIKG